MRLRLSRGRTWARTAASRHCCGLRSHRPPAAAAAPASFPRAASEGSASPPSPGGVGGGDHSNSACRVGGGKCCLVVWAPISPMTHDRNITCPLAICVSSWGEMCPRVPGPFLSGIVYLFVVESQEFFIYSGSRPSPRTDLHIRAPISELYARVLGSDLGSPQVSFRRSRAAGLALALQWFL